jgi:hypothetical protein
VYARLVLGERRIIGVARRIKYTMKKPLLPWEEGFVIPDYKGKYQE